MSNSELIKIEKLVYEGFGLARKDGKVFFVKKSVPGDELKILELKNKKNVVEGKIKEIISPSSDRIKPKCPHFDDCGGCEHMNISYENQLKYKDQIFREVMQRAKVKSDILDIIPGSFEPYFYRNSIRFFFKLNKENNISFARQNANYQKGLVNVDACLLQSETANKIMAQLREYINENVDNKSSFWQLKIREGKMTGDFMVEIITCDHDLPKEKGIVEILKSIKGIKSVYHTIAPGKSLKQLSRRLIFGSPVIFEKIGKFKFQISPESFFQTNSLGVKTLYDSIKQFADIKFGDNILDLYCGTGTIGIYLSTLAKKVTGTEVVQKAVNDARDNAKINRIPNTEFFCFDLSDPNNLIIQQFNNTIVILDPPRAGLNKELIAKLSASNFSRLIYVSCNPATFARDIKIFEEYNIKLIKVQPIDMFPQTHHIECVGLLVKSNLT